LRLSAERLRGSRILTNERRVSQILKAVSTHNNNNPTLSTCKTLFWLLCAGQMTGKKQNRLQTSSSSYVMGDEMSEGSQHVERFISKDSGKQCGVPELAR
jgi:hypothetical protein